MAPDPPSLKRISKTAGGSFHEYLADHILWRRSRSLRVLWDVFWGRANRVGREVAVALEAA